MWEPRCLTVLWASRVCYRDSFTFYQFLRSAEGSFDLVKLGRNVKTPDYFYPVERLTIHGVLPPYSAFIFTERLLIAEIALKNKCLLITAALDCHGFPRVGHPCPFK
jgi:hypothetical protein